MTVSLIQTTILILAADLTLTIFLLFSSALSERLRYCFLTCNVIAAVMTICNIVLYSFANKAPYVIFLKAAAAVSCSVSGLAALPFISVSSVIGKRLRAVTYALGAVNALLCVISISNGCVFSYDDKGAYSAGSLFFIPLLVCGAYTAVLITASVIKFRLGFRSEGVFLAVFSLSFLFSLFIGQLTELKLLTGGAAVLGCTFYTLFFTTQTLDRDSMTNALNRHSFYKDIAELRKRQMFIISLDINGLQQINDNLGHEEGDKAILALSESAADILSSNCRIYRMGGDEFQILCPSSSRSDVEIMIQKIKESVHEKGYSVAVGYGEYKKGMDLDDFIREIDAIMYEDKARMKAKQGL